ncbi:MAG TPA: CHAT domain-containing protein, partial [Roseiflexaceae bacterium]|nr:CHAT domain-containing protein [Roseiflexaceae bacterium]
MKTYVDFEIRIAPGPKDYNAYASGPGGNESGAFVPPSDPAFQALLQQLADFDIDEDGLIQIGQQLFQALFHDKIKSAYERAQAQAEQNGDQGIRLRLNIDPRETAVTRLPWEFLNDPDRGPLAMLDTPVVR